MSIYSTLQLTESEAIMILAKHLGVYEENNTKQEMLAACLFKITDCNDYSPYHWNNYWIYPDGTPVRTGEYDEKELP